MSELERRIAERDEVLTRRRNHIRTRASRLRVAARHWCARPTTLLGAGLAGAAVGYVYPPNRIARQGRDAVTKGQSFMQRQTGKLVKFLVFQQIVRAIERARSSDTDCEPGPEAQNPAAPSQV